PAIFTYPPKGSQPIPYTVSPIFFLNKENFTSKNRKNFSTRVLNILAGIKCPSSCNTINSDKLNKNCDNLTNMSINYYFLILMHKCKILSLLLPQFKSILIFYNFFMIGFRRCIDS